MKVLKLLMFVLYHRYFVFQSLLPQYQLEQRTVELFLVLKNVGCDLKGDFVVEITKRLGSNEAVESDGSRSISRLIGTEIVGMLNLKDYRKTILMNAFLR